MEKFGWKPYKQKHFESRFTEFYESFWLYERFGYDVRRVQFSSLILTNQMTREKALEELEKPPYTKSSLEKDKEFISNKLDITVNELDEYFNLDKKNFKDFKNQSMIYSIGEYFMTKLSLKKGGKR